MFNIDASTPQLKALEKLLEAYASLDANNPDPSLSKNYKHETFPKSIGLPEETKEEHIERFKKTLPVLTELAVRIQHRRTAFNLVLISTASSLLLTK